MASRACEGSCPCRLSAVARARKVRYSTRDKCDQRDGQRAPRAPQVRCAHVQHLGEACKDNNHELHRGEQDARAAVGVRIPVGPASPKTAGQKRKELRVRHTLGLAIIRSNQVHYRGVAADAGGGRAEEGRGKSTRTALGLEPDASHDKQLTRPCTQAQGCSGHTPP